MKIILMRHGKPVFAPTAWIAPIEMEQWIKDYNLSEVATDSVPSASLELAHSVACIVASTAPRACGIGLDRYYEEQILEYQHP